MGETEEGGRGERRKGAKVEYEIGRRATGKRDAAGGMWLRP